MLTTARRRRRDDATAADRHVHPPRVFLFGRYNFGHAFSKDPRDNPEMPPLRPRREWAFTALEVSRDTQ